MTNTDNSAMIAKGMQTLTDKITSLLVPLLIGIFLATAIRGGIVIYMRKTGYKRATIDAVSYFVYAILMLGVLTLWGRYAISYH